MQLGGMGTLHGSRFVRWGATMLQGPSACISLTLSSAFVLQLLQECTPKQIMSLSHAVVPGCSGLYEGSI